LKSLTYFQLQFEKALPEEQQTLNLVGSIQRNTKRYIDVFSQAVDAVMPKETKDVTYVNECGAVIYAELT